VGGSIRDIQHCAGLAIPHVRATKAKGVLKSPADRQRQARLGRLAAANNLPGATDAE
jgi:hypothetical protein